MKKYVCGPCGYVYDPEVEIQMEELHLEHHLKIFQMMGMSNLWIG